MNLVIDASVAAKWLVAEPDADKALELLDQWGGGEVHILAPATLPLEIASVLWKRAIRNLLPAERVLALYAQFRRTCPRLVPLDSLVELAFRLALDYRHSVYDSLYVVLAMESDCNLLTADEKLYRAFAPSFPQIRLLRNWKP